MVIPSLTYALFVDRIPSTGNTFTSTTLETNIVPEFTPPIVRTLTYEQPISFSFALYNIGELQSKNNIYVVDISNSELASVIDVQVILDDTTTIYTGKLDTLLINSYLTQNNGDSNKVSFRFSISETDYNNALNKDLSFRIQNHAWQSTLEYGKGFFDNEYIEVNFIESTT